MGRADVEYKFLGLACTLHEDRSDACRLQVTWLDTPVSCSRRRQSGQNVAQGLISCTSRQGSVCLDQSACLLQFQRQAAKTAAVPKQAQQEEEGDSKMEIFVTLPPDQPCSAKEDNNHISNCVDRT